MMRAREAVYIGLFDSLPLLRDPMLMILLSLISFLPVLFIFVFNAGQQAFLQSVVGAIVLSLAFAGIGSAQSVYFNKHWFRFQDIFVASRVSPVSYAIGLSVSTLLVSLPALVIAMTLLLLETSAGILGILAVALVALVTWIAMLLLGFVLGASTKNTRRANSLPQLLGLLLGFLPPVYYPLDRLPVFLQPLALLIPTTQAAQLSKNYAGLLAVPLTGTELVFGWAYLIGFAVALALLASRLAHWTDP
ncbi:MAG TPA: ABC transporter permease [Thermoplasmata archaeon]|nr:ABC transporter permease [Thermoplasmata archaeon]